MAYPIQVNIEVLVLPRASNIGDFDPLRSDPSAYVRFVRMGEELGSPDIVILPGTRNTILDYQHIKKAGYVGKIKELARKKAIVFGIGGGFQMLGTKIIDIKGSESHLSQTDGFCFLPIVTRIMPSEVSSEVRFDTIENNLIKDGPRANMKGFESHLGRTKYLNGSKPLFRIIERHKKEVAIFDGAVNEEAGAAGTYIHGVFHNDLFRHYFLDCARERKQ